MKYTIAIYVHRRERPRLSVVPLRSIYSKPENPRYIGVQFNLIWWSVEFVR